MTTTMSPDMRATLTEMAALLTLAASRGRANLDADLAQHTLSVRAQLVASRVLELLPDELPPLDDFEPKPVGLDQIGLIFAAEAASRRHPIEQLPAGFSQVVIALGDLVNECPR
ncbi:MAG: hypothetical protein KQH57_11140 [Actinomycetales bacterium]|nr:hypothetical protein [Actinomycetales bacterium]